MQIVEKIETLVKFSESSLPETLIICGVIIFIFAILRLFEVIIKGYSQNIIELYTIVTITSVIFVGIGFYKSTVLDSIIPTSKETQYETNVDKNKYE